MVAGSTPVALQTVLDRPDQRALAPCRRLSTETGIDKDWPRPVPLDQPDIIIQRHGRGMIVGHRTPAIKLSAATLLMARISDRMDAVPGHSASLEEEPHGQLGGAMTDGGHPWLDLAGQFDALDLADQRPRIASASI